MTNKFDTRMDKLEASLKELTDKAKEEVDPLIEKRYKVKISQLENDLEKMKAKEKPKEKEEPEKETETKAEPEKHTKEKGSLEKAYDFLMEW